jgi:muconate cycloisomerase
VTEVIENPTAANGSPAAAAASDLQITGVDLFTVGLPPRREHPTAYRMDHLGKYVIVRIVTNAGIVGLGESTVLPDWGGDHGRYYGESVGSTHLMIRDFFTPQLIGEDPFRISHLMGKLARLIKGYPYAKAAIDIALHDIKGKALGVPVYELLGGLYRREVRMAHSIAILENERVLDEAREAVAEGIGTIKLKIGKDARRDVQIVHAVRAVVGPEVEITVDANQGYASPKEALKVLREFAEADVRFAEQMTAGIENLAKIARESAVPQMADESVWSAFDALDAIQRDAAEFISIYTTKPGGLLGAMKVAAVCEAAGIRCNVNGSAETGVGTAANLHLVAAGVPIVEANVFPVTRRDDNQPTKLACAFYLDDIIKEPFEYRDGCMIVPDKPGLGIELDDAKVEKYLVS